MADGQKRKRAGLVLLFYMTLIGLALFFEHPNGVTEFAFNLFSEGDNCRGREETTLHIAAFPYKLISNAYSAPGELRVRLVTFERGSEPRNIFGDENLCRQRLFLARLIERLEQLGAKSIVVDKYFDPHTCDNLPNGLANGTEELLRVVRTTSVPITLGLHTTDVGGLAGKSREIKTCMILAGAMQFGSGNCAGTNKCVEEGTIRLNTDTRRIPIKWEVFESEREAEQNANPRVFESLSVVAALQSNPEAKARKRLVELLSARDPSHPFTSFIQEIPKFHARQVVCGVDFAEDAGPDWHQTCRPPRIEVSLGTPPTGRLTNEEIAQEISGRTIVIGEFTEDDEHDSVIGAAVPGAMLQANYIQSLLDGRYFPAVNGWVSFLCYLAWFALTYVLFSKRSPGAAAGWSVVALVMLVLFSFVLIRYFDRIFPWGLETVISLFAIIGVHWVHARGHGTPLEIVRTGEKP
jgi:hypothetical protein